MSNGFSFPPHGKAAWGEPTTASLAENAAHTPALELFSSLSHQGQQSFEMQGLHVATTRELTRRVSALERAHEHDADHMTTCSVGLSNLRDDVRIIMEGKQAEIDALRDEIASLHEQLRALLKVAA